jgi:hypothetical protein
MFNLLHTARDRTARRGCEKKGAVLAGLPALPRVSGTAAPIQHYLQRYLDPFPFKAKRTKAAIALLLLAVTGLVFLFWIAPKPFIPLVSFPRLVMQAELGRMRFAPNIPIHHADVIKRFEVLLPRK